MFNRHLEKYKYTPWRVRDPSAGGPGVVSDGPSGAGPGGGGPPVSSSAPISAPDTHSGQPIIVHAHPGFLGSLGQALGNATVLVAAALIVARLTVPAPPVLAPPPGAVLPRPLNAILIQRNENFEGALAELDEKHGWTTNLAYDWNTGERRSTFGTPQGPKYFYVAKVRPGHESDLNRLEYGGTDRIWLTLVYPPSTWSDLDLNSRLHKWAKLCKSEVAWINDWSSFPRGRRPRPKNECKPGGVCVILSDHPCAGTAFEGDFST